MKELHEPSVAYTRNTELPTFFGQPMLKGTFIEIEKDQTTPEMLVNVRLREQISDFQRFLVKDMWVMSEPT